MNTYGMTLVETMIALALMVGIMTVMFSLNSLLSHQYALDRFQAERFIEASTISAKLYTEYLRGSTFVFKDRHIIASRSGLEIPVSDVIPVTSFVVDGPFATFALQGSSAINTVLLAD